MASHFEEFAASEGLVRGKDDSAWDWGKRFWNGALEHAIRDWDGHPTDGFTDVQININILNRLKEGGDAK